MKGSEKQIKWAEEIKESKESEFETIMSNARPETQEIVNKAVNFVRNIEDASFWIDLRNVKPIDMLSKMMTTGLQYRGYEYSAKAILDPTTGLITKTWEDRNWITQFEII